MSETEWDTQRQPVATRTALVTGAKGVVGPRLVQQLLQAGYRVHTLDRTNPPPGFFPLGVKSWSGDICDQELIQRSVQGVDVVFHLAARLHIPNPPPELRPEYWRVNVEGTRGLAEACAAAGARRLVLFSTINVYGAIDGTSADENTPPRPNGLYAETKLAAEEIVLSTKDPGTGKPLGVVLRLAAIYGPGMKGNYPKLVRALSRGLFVPIGDGNNRRTLLFTEDAVRATILAAQHPGAAGQIYNVSDGGNHLLCEIIAAICAALGRRPPRWHVPSKPALLAARVVDAVSGLAGRSFDLAGRIKKLTEDVAVSSARIRQDLGFQALYGLEEGWRLTLVGRTAGEPKPENRRP